ncbi:AAA family ATPase [Vitreimonas sp.]|uniref:AAA family ATPase n=1 Tax=Vitreimonas sp. TaxID=3069702 RepID=UPI0039C95069
MEAARTLKPRELMDFLLNVAPVRPVFVWGPPGIGKSSIVQQFAEAVGLDCVSLLGSQLAPEDLIGVPKIEGGKTRFHPPAQIARETAYCLFLDELNACSHDVQKAFYSLINDRRIGEYALPQGSVVIGAGNRAQDAAIVRALSSALINRLIHVQLRADAADWIAWAEGSSVDPLVIDYIRLRPDQLWSKPPKHEEPFSTPRAWAFLSEAWQAYAEDNRNEAVADVLASGLLTPSHARGFIAFYRQRQRAFDLNAILKGERKWPDKPDERDILYFLTQSFRAQLIKELPEEGVKLSKPVRELSMRAKDALIQLSRISVEMAQLVLAADENGNSLPDWFMVEIARDLPRLVGRG